MEPTLRPQTIKTWIAEQLTHNLTTEDGDKLDKISLCIVKNGGISEPEELKTIVIGSKEWDPKDLARSLEQTAITFAAGVPGRQQFLLIAHFQPSDRKEQFAFGKAGEPELGVGGLATEPATERGHMAQMMRHNETIYRIGTMHQEAVFDKLMRVIEHTSKMNESLLNENAEVMLAVKQMIIEKANDQHAKQKELLEYQRGTLMREQMMQYAPGLLNKVSEALTGKKLLPENTLIEGAMKNIANSLTQDQIVGLSQILTTEQLAQLAPILTSLQDKPKQEIVDAVPEPK